MFCCLNNQKATLENAALLIKIYLQDSIQNSTSLSISKIDCPVNHMQIIRLEYDIFVCINIELYIGPV